MSVVDTDNLPRVAPKAGITIGDATFSEGTVLSVNPWVIHFSKEIWGPDAREFNPSRWLQPDGAAKETYLMPVCGPDFDLPSMNKSETMYSNPSNSSIRTRELMLVIFLISATGSLHY
jgi:hypothetical protein